MQRIHYQALLFVVEKATEKTDSPLFSYKDCLQGDERYRGNLDLYYEYLFEAQYYNSMRQ